MPWLFMVVVIVVAVVAVVAAVAVAYIAAVVHRCWCLCPLLLGEPRLFLLFLCCCSCHESQSSD